MKTLLPYLQLIRLPNVFTAMADIIMACLVVGALPEHWLPFILILLASSLLYCSGMVWNDFFDLEQDKKERPFRPIPSGRVSLRQAATLAVGLMGIGILLATIADFRSDGFRGLTSLLAVLLAGTILLYDGWLKRTVMGPVAMGTCRFLNVLLGLSVHAVWIGNWGILLALVVGVYIVGVTFFARTEAKESNQFHLICATLIMLASIVLALILPHVGGVLSEEDTNSWIYSQARLRHWIFPILLVAFGIYLGIPIFKAIRHPLPKHVQPAVKQSVLGLVILDAILTTPFVGPAGLLLILLLVPAKLIGKWVYST